MDWLHQVHMYFRFCIHHCKPEEAGIVPDVRTCILETTRADRVGVGHWVFSASAVFFISSSDHGDNRRRMAVVLPGGHSSMHCVWIVRALSIEIIDKE